MPHFDYVGSGPYCYANCLAMMTGDHSPGVIEFATCSPFGMQAFSNLIFFDPFGWDPLQGIEHALKVMGWEATEIVSPDETEALKKLKEELVKGPVFVGPVEMGLLFHQPTARGAIGADHYVIVQSITDGMVLLHDPHGYPYATLPVDDFMKSWRAQLVGYGKPFTMRCNFKRVEHVSEEDVIRRSISEAIQWLSMSKGQDMPPDAKGNGDAASVLAAKIKQNYTPDLKAPLVYFAVQVGARRAADGAESLSRIGYEDAARIMTEQAKLIGSLQYPLVKGQVNKAVDILKQLEPVYERLRIALEQKVGNSE